jgi:hypothetical protein
MHLNNYFNIKEPEAYFPVIAPIELKFCTDYFFIDWSYPKKGRGIFKNIFIRSKQEPLWYIKIQSDSKYFKAIINNFIVNRQILANSYEVCICNLYRTDITK